MPVTVHKDAVNNAVHSQYHESLEGATWSELFKSNDPDHPLTAGIAIMEKGPVVTWTYHGNEFCILLEGELHLKDNHDDQLHELAVGDVVRVDKGSVITFSTPSRSKALFVSQYPHDTPVENLLKVH
ncbi:hypothetical protein FRC03_001639 [Tulasnella sp. 419]|nr:hypothetical protein FRC02_001718 [Tulasnella sp. 418]KAG8945756.1 hypothetical protein FRC03_001639 [Tulasnella sp. 419]